jgi:tetratricopeptide (TPR) repeat protein
MSANPVPAPAGDLTPALEEAIARGYAERDRDNMEPTIRYFEDLLAANPGHPVLTYEVAGAYDTAGREAEARGRYEEAMRLGLAGDALRRCLCQYGSTLRWLGDYAASRQVLERARREFPGSDAVRVFHALTLNDAGEGDMAVGELLAVVTRHADVTDLGRYAGGLGGLAQWLIDGRPED